MRAARDAPGGRESIAAAFRPLLGQPCWGVSYHRQVNLSMNFGQPHLEIREPRASEAESERVRRLLAQRRVTVRGEWWLWFYLCSWRLSSGETVLARNSSSMPRIERAVAELDGQALVAVEVSPRTGATRFRFDLGATLDCRPFEKGSDRDVWLLYEPDGYVLSVQANGTFCHHPGSCREKQCQPIGGKALVVTP